MTLDRFSRQSFLGEHAQTAIEGAVVGICGLGGGGSHIVQQLAHLGFGNYVLVDPDIVEFHNLNRLVGATVEDANRRVAKVDVARRLILGLNPKARIEHHQSIWQENAMHLRRCDIIFSALDSFDQRRQLETLARNFLTPLVDIGMDVVIVEPEPPQMAGQVILSMPGHACMRCLGFLSEESLAREAARYGDAGPRPQVVWANGDLASSAVGIAVDLLTDLSKQLRDTVYLSYRGNSGVRVPHARLPYVKLGACPHFPLIKIGTPKISSL